MKRLNVIISILLIAIIVLVACSNSNQTSENSAIDSLVEIDSSEVSDSTGEQSNLTAQANQENSKKEPLKENPSSVKDAKEDSVKAGNESNKAEDKKDESSRTGNDVANTKIENSGSGPKQESSTGGNSNNSTGSNQSSHKHSYRSVVTEPTCTAEGYTTYTCSCGNSYKETIAALGHVAHREDCWIPFGHLEYFWCYRCEQYTGETRTAPGYNDKPYYLTQADIDEIYARVRAIGESYGLKYYSEASGYVGDTWLAPIPVYEDELYLGRDHIMSELIDYCGGWFQEIVKNSDMSDSRYYDPGFGLYLKCPGTYSYYELYINWV